VGRGGVGRETAGRWGHRGRWPRGVGFSGFGDHGQGRLVVAMGLVVVVKGLVVVAKDSGGGQGLVVVATGLVVVSRG